MNASEAALLIAAVFSGLSSLIAAVAAAYAAVMAARTEKNTNSIVTQLVKTAKSESHAAGVKEGGAAEMAEQAKRDSIRLNRPDPRV